MKAKRKTVFYLLFQKYYYQAPDQSKLPHHPDVNQWQPQISPQLPAGNSGYKHTMIGGLVWQVCVSVSSHSL